MFLNTNVKKKKNLALFFKRCYLQNKMKLNRELLNRKAINQLSFYQMISRKVIWNTQNLKMYFRSMNQKNLNVLQFGMFRLK